MSTAQEAPPVPERRTDPPTGHRPFSITAEVFFRMLDAEVFGDEDRVELWDGLVVEKMAKTNAHAGSGIKVTMALVPLLPPGWCLSPENPVALGPKRIPLLDFCVLRGGGDDYGRRRPDPLDVDLLVELSYSSLKDDLGPRLAAYAAAGIPTYWVLNLIDHVIITFERPVPAEGRYESSTAYAIGRSVPFRLDGVPIAEIPAADLLPASA